VNDFPKVVMQKFQTKPRTTTFRLQDLQPTVAQTRRDIHIYSYINTMLNKQPS